MHAHDTQTMPRKLQLYRAAFYTGAALALADIVIFALCAEKSESVAWWPVA